MPPNFPEFAERIEASLSEVSEAGASNPSLQEKRESSAMLAEGSGRSDHGEPMSESLTLEHVSKAAGAADALPAKHLSEDCYEYSQEECQPLLNPEDLPLPGRDFSRGRRLPSATWPRARKNLVRGSLNDGHQETLEASEADCVVENVNLSPCLSEELLDAGLNILLTSNLREKTESELRFEEDERWVMMEEWEEATLSERGKTVPLAEERKSCCLADISEEREQFPAADPAAAPGPWTPPGAGTSEPCEPAGAAGARRSTEDAAVQCEAEDLGPSWERSGSPLGPEPLSDTDSVQMFLELEQQCLDEEEADGAVSLELQGCISLVDPEGPDPHADSGKLAVDATAAREHVAALEGSASDSAVVSDLEDLDATCSSQGTSAAEPATEPYSERETSAITATDSDGAVSPGAAAAVGPTLPPRAPATEEARGPLLDGEPWAACAGAGPAPCRAPASPEGDESQIWGLEGMISHLDISMLGSDDCQDVSGSAGAEPSAETWPGSARLAEEPGSPQDCALLKDVEGTEVSDVPGRLDPLPSERTELTNWDIPELLSEDELTDLERESDGSEGRSHPVQHAASPCSSSASFPAGSASEQGSEEPAAAEGLAPETLLPEEIPASAAGTSGSPRSTARAPEAEAGVLQPGDLDLLFALFAGACEDGEVAAEHAGPPSPRTASPDPGDRFHAAPAAAALLLHTDDLAALEPCAWEFHPAAGDATGAAQELHAWCLPPDAAVDAMVLEEPLEAPAPFADELATAVSGIQVPEGALVFPALPAAGMPGRTSEGTARDAGGATLPHTPEHPEEAPAPTETPGALGAEGPAEPGAAAEPGPFHAPGRGAASPPAAGEAPAAEPLADNEVFVLRALAGRVLGADPPCLGPGGRLSARCRGLERPLFPLAPLAAHVQVRRRPSEPPRSLSSHPRLSWGLMEVPCVRSDTNCGFCWQVFLASAGWGAACRIQRGKGA
uniref:Uncharacterized protein n=1 Tax=Nothoprocta perdicaria TaxID=30464 RepID=A0A8C6ZCG8_NOTPE